MLSAFCGPRGLETLYKGKHSSECPPSPAMQRRATVYSETITLGLWSLDGLGFEPGFCHRIDLDNLLELHFPHLQMSRVVISYYPSWRTVENIKGHEVPSTVSVHHRASNTDDCSSKYYSDIIRIPFHNLDNTVCLILPSAPPWMFPQVKSMYLCLYEKEEYI